MEKTPTSSIKSDLQEISGAAEQSVKAAAHKVDSVLSKISDSLGVRGASLIMESAIVLALTFVICISIYFFINTIINRVAKFTWKSILWRSLQKPFVLYIACFGISYILKNLAAFGIPAKYLNGLLMREISATFSVSWFVINILNRIESKIYHSAKTSKLGIDKTTTIGVSRLVKTIIVFFTIIILLEINEISTTGLLTMGGVGGIAITFASKDLLANFFGAFMIYFDKPFGVGDWIKIKSKDIEGVVEEIGWRMTKIRTFEKRPIYVPNVIFTSSSIENPSRMSHRRIREVIGVRYDDIKVLPTIIEEVKKMLQKHEGIDESQTLIVNFDHFADSSVNFFIYTFTHTTKWRRFHEIKQDVLVKIADIIAKQNAEIAYPTRTVLTKDTTTK